MPPDDLVARIRLPESADRSSFRHPVASDTPRKLDGLHSTPYRSMRQLTHGASREDVSRWVRGPKMAIQRLAPPMAVLILKKSAFGLMTDAHLGRRMTILSDCK